MSEARELLQHRPDLLRPDQRRVDICRALAGMLSFFRKDLGRVLMFQHPDPRRRGKDMMGEGDKDLPETVFKGVVDGTTDDGRPGGGGAGGPVGGGGGGAGDALRAAVHVDGSFYVVAGLVPFNEGKGSTYGGTVVMNVCEKDSGQSVLSFDAPLGSVGISIDPAPAHWTSLEMLKREIRRRLLQQQ